jgi:hypothetical protein
VFSVDLPREKVPTLRVLLCASAGKNAGSHASATAHPHPAPPAGPDWPWQIYACPATDYLIGGFWVLRLPRWVPKLFFFLVKLPPEEFCRRRTKASYLSLLPNCPASTARVAILDAPSIATVSSTQPDKQTLQWVSSLEVVAVAAVVSVAVVAAVVTVVVAAAVVSAVDVVVVVLTAVVVVVVAAVVVAVPVVLVAVAVLVAAAAVVPVVVPVVVPRSLL